MAEKTWLRQIVYIATVEGYLTLATYKELIYFWHRVLFAVDIFIVMRKIMLRIVLSCLLNCLYLKYKVLGNNLAAVITMNEK